MEFRAAVEIAGAQLCIACRKPFPVGKWTWVHDRHFKDSKCLRFLLGKTNAELNELYSALNPHLRGR